MRMYEAFERQRLITMQTQFCAISFPVLSGMTSAANSGVNGCGLT